VKYRHSFHAGNFADIHKHVTLLALLAALKRKDKGFAYLETHAGRGAYELSHQSAEAVEGRGRFDAGDYQADELRDFAALIAGLSRLTGDRRVAATAAGPRHRQRAYSGRGADAGA
jgi:23S rRNA (adenine2030-N6)-methyltransferase